ncbi:ribosomal RNA processing protein 1 homolog B [Talpa occidentalis]|uniref:ribosomal RNA processing protein 1 homolog B n=1 Tax=Talpa occidentalis TaxID=50954 RepID=UPI00188DF10F|nr:ribosomal RNA processing protein 1 homolog B [Talpa occidentalis]
MHPPELQFAQRLASRERGVRERAARRLRQYISAKTRREAGGFSQEELLKIWKGLFYCMWVQDEPLLQEELAVTISHLVHVVNNLEAQHLFLQTFWQTLNREWAGIDRPRLDKYHMLIRLVLRQSLEVLKRNGWEESRIQLFLDILTTEVLRPESRSPNGVKFHFIDIYLDELSKVGGKELLADQNLKFIDPFCKIAAKTKDHTLVQTIARAVFEAIVHQSPLAPEEAMEGQSAQVGDGGPLAEEPPAGEAVWSEAASAPGAALSECHSRRDGVRDGNASDTSHAEDGGPLLQFDYKAVADRLLEMTNRKNTPPFNRKRLSRLVKKFQGLSEGEEGRGDRWRCSREGRVAQLSLAEQDGPSPGQGRHKRKGNKLGQSSDMESQRGDSLLAEEEGSEGSVQTRRRKRRKRSHVQPEHSRSGGEAISPEPHQGDEPEGAPERAQKTSALELGVAAQPGPEQPPKPRRKRPRKKGLRGQGPGLERMAVAPPPDLSPGSPSSGLSQEPAAPGSPTTGAHIPKRPCKLGVLPANSSSLPTLAWPLTQKEEPPVSRVEGGDCPRHRPQGGRLKKRKGQPSTLDLCDPAGPKNAILKKRKKMKEMSNLVAHGGLLRPEAQLLRALGNRGALGPLKKQQLRTENDFVRFDTPFLPKALFFRRAKGATACPLSPAVQLKAPPSSKKVTFGLSRNMTAEFKKTDKSILVSPTGLSRVAFNPEQRPLHGVLKAPASSPGSTPLGPRKLLTTTPQRRPTAMDFF